MPPALRARADYFSTNLFNTSVEIPVGNLRTDANRPVFMRGSPICTKSRAAAFKASEQHIPNYLSTPFLPESVPANSREKLRES